MMLESGKLVSGRYRILEQIGIGGTAVVYKATDEKLGRVVTLKALREDFIDNEDFIKRFNKEAQAAAKLNHPNIVSAYDVGRDGDIIYIIMEYIDGFTLKELIIKNAPFSNEETLGVSMQIASALEAAHENQIIHRDIKPQNIMVTRDGNIKVSDFGIAKAAGSSTITAEQMGSAHYFSPEQARGGFVDIRSDIYSLGITMYEMLTGKVPFDGESPVALAIKHMDEPLPDIRQFNPNASLSLIKIIGKATEKKAAARYQSIKEMERDLHRAVDDSSGRFVTKNRIDSQSSTIVITDGERKAIREEAAKRSAAEDAEERREKAMQQKRRQQALKTREERERRRIEEEERVKSHRIIAGAVITGVAIITVIVIMFAVFMSGNGLKMPNLVGSTEDSALKIAQNLGITLEIEEVESEEGPESTVVWQEIEEGGKISRGDTVKVQVSLGNGDQKMPNLVGKDYRDAQEMLQEMRIKYTIEQYDGETNIGKGIVAKTVPERGETVSSGDEVTMYVNLDDDEEMLEVLDVLGLEEAEAVKRLEEEGFEVKVEQEFSDKYKEGLVCAQNPNGGAEVLDEKDGKKVTIIISKGEKPKEEVTTEEPKQQVTENNSDGAGTNSGDNQNSGARSINVPLPPVEGTVGECKVAEVGLDGQETVVWSGSGITGGGSTPPIETAGSTFKVYYDGIDVGEYYYEDGSTQPSQIR